MSACTCGACAPCGPGKCPASRTTEHSLLRDAFRASQQKCAPEPQLSVNLPGAVVEALQRRAKAEGRTMADVLRESICKESEVEGK